MTEHAQFSFIHDGFAADIDTHSHDTGFNLFYVSKGEKNSVICLDASVLRCRYLLHRTWHFTASLDG